jgi:hypothetical protein
MAGSADLSAICAAALSPFVIASSTPRKLVLTIVRRFLFTSVFRPCDRTAFLADAVLAIHSSVCLFAILISEAAYIRANLTRQQRYSFFKVNRG